MVPVWLFVNIGQAFQNQRILPSLHQALYADCKTEFVSALLPLRFFSIDNKYIFADIYDQPLILLILICNFFLLLHREKFEFVCRQCRIRNEFHFYEKLELQFRQPADGADRKVFRDYRIDP